MFLSGPWNEGEKVPMAHVTVDGRIYDLEN
jgi:hypothetical protein